MKLAYAWLEGRTPVLREIEAEDDSATEQAAALIRDPRCLGVVVLHDNGAVDARYEKPTLVGRYPTGYPSPARRAETAAETWGAPPPPVREVPADDDDPTGLAEDDARIAAPVAAVAARQASAGCDVCGGPPAVDQLSPSTRMAHHCCGGCGRLLPAMSLRDIERMYLLAKSPNATVR